MERINDNMNISEVLQKSDAIQFVKDTQLKNLIGQTNLKTYWMDPINSLNIMNISNKFDAEYKKNKEEYELDYRNLDENELRIIIDKLTTFSNQYEVIIDCVGKLNAAFHYQSINEKKSDEKEEFEALVAYTGIHIKRLQYQCDRVIFCKQHKEIGSSFRWQQKDSKNNLNFAKFVAIFSFVLAAGSIVVTILYGEGCLGSNTKYSKPPENTEYCNPQDTTPPLKPQECIENNSDEKNHNQVDTTFNNNKQ